MGIPTWAMLGLASAEAGWTTDEGKRLDLYLPDELSYGGPPSPTIGALPGTSIRVTWMDTGC